MPTLSGRVLEKWSGVPVSGAVVVINGITVIADGAGNFSINTPYQTANIQVLHVGYEPVVETLSLSSQGNPVEIALTPIARAL